MRKLAILGSTGSIGTQTLEIVRKQGMMEVVALAAYHNTKLMEEQIREFHPDYAVMYDENAAKELRERTIDLPVKILSGMSGLLEIVALPKVDMVVTGLVGMIGVLPTIEAINAGKTIALANKETLVTAGHIIMPLAKEKQVQILPVDSEHSAIFQSLNGENRDKLSRILLTASGGPFLGKTYEELSKMTVEDALKHPNWSMGKKVTIDSASLVNKGLEVMEAKWLFNCDVDQIKVLVHPQSIIHSMVEYTDGAVIAQMGIPDMKLPIQYALFYPERMPMENNRVDFAARGQLTFLEPDVKTFRGLSLAYNAISVGGSAPTVFNAANEVAVKAFLNHKICFTAIYEWIECAMSNIPVISNPTVNEVLQKEQETYEYLKQVM